MYKLLAIDMDGTLLKDDRTISELTKKKLRNAVESGVKVVLATGRPIQGIIRYLEELGLTDKEDYAITINGALVSRASDYSVVSSSATLTGKDIKHIYSKTRHINTYFHAFTSKLDLVDRESKFSEDEEKRLGLKVKAVDFLKDVKDEDVIFKAVMEEESDMLDEAASKIPSELFEEYNIIRSVWFMLEFTNKNCNKATGLEMLARHLGINREEIIAVGDAENDIEMIEYAGLGVAMGNAKEEIKRRSDFVTKSNEEDGIAHVIDKFILSV